ncbi:MAG: PucR C-terminal helix-turn-helix protein [Actinomycetia bacterium]|nr:PucR C-terminal helix-turn-helix protein [Actinomycetes bacterium]
MAEATLITPLGTRIPTAPDVALVLRSELSSLADEIVAEIRRSVPEFDRPLRGRFGTGIRLGVEQGLRQFVDQIADPLARREPGIKVYQGLGRGEYLEGRDLDALQAAYRVGARVAWRRIAEVGRQAGWPAQTMSLLAEAAFTHVDEIAAYSVEGHSQARENATGRLQHLRQRLLELILARDRSISGDALSGLAREAQWRLPGTVACVAVTEWRGGGSRLEPAVGPDVLMDLGQPDPCLLVPDPDAPGRQNMLAHALRDSLFAIGPSVPLADAPLSLRLAGQALSLVQRGVIKCDHYVRCTDELSTLLLFHDEDMVQLMTQRRYGPLAALRAHQRIRLSETLLAWLATGGSAPQIAASLHIHAQTVRYRMRQLQELFGDAMDDPNWKFEMEIVLRTQLLLKTAPAPRQPA